MNYSRMLDKKNIKGFSFGIYGAGGTGKTSFVKNLPSDQTLYISIDDSSHPILKSNFFMVTLPKPTNDDPSQFISSLSEVYSDIRLNKTIPFKFIVIDSVSELERYFQLASVYKRMKMRNYKDIGDTVPTQKDYGDASILTNKWLIQFRDLKNPDTNEAKRAINTFFIANDMSREISRNDEETTTKITPFLTSKMANKYRDMVDVLGYLTARSNGSRYLHLIPSHKWEAKNRFSSFTSMQIEFDFNIEEKVLSPIRNELKTIFK